MYLLSKHFHPLDFIFAERYKDRELELNCEHWFSENNAEMGESAFSNRLLEISKKPS